MYNIVIKVLGKYWTILDKCLVNIGFLLALGNVFYTTRETWMGKTESRTGLRLPSEKPSRQALKKKKDLKIEFLEFLRLKVVKKSPGKGSRQLCFVIVGP